MDDCSTDRTMEIAQRIQEDDKRIRIIRNERNLGITGNMNKGISLCNGKYVAILDGDDWVSVQNRKTG